MEDLLLKSAFPRFSKVIHQTGIAAVMSAAHRCWPNDGLLNGSAILELKRVTSIMFSYRRLESPRART